MDKPIKTSFVWVVDPQGKIALIQEGGRQARGLWCLPGGHVGEGEAPEKAAVREAKEEAGLDVEVVSKAASIILDGVTYLGNPAENDKQIEVNIFKAKPLGFSIKQGEKELGARWCSKEEMKTMKFRWPFLMEVLLS